MFAGVTFAARFATVCPLFYWQGAMAQRHHRKSVRIPGTPVVRQGAIAPRDQLVAWMVQQGVAGLPIEALERLDLDRFLRETAALTVPDTERLRELAILAEPAAAAAIQPRGWRLLQRIYDRAAQRAAPTPWIAHSRAVSALACVDRRLPEPVRAQILADAKAALEAALFSFPRQAALLEAMGELCFRGSDHDAALSWCSRALAVDPTLSWAALYRAHCLRELERWGEAVSAYDAVPRAAFTGPSAWRGARLLEQRAWCRLQDDDEAGALRDFLDALGRYERDLALADRAMSRVLVTAAAKVFPDALRQRTLAVACAIRWLWAQDMLMPIDPV